MSLLRDAEWTPWGHQPLASNDNNPSQDLPPVIALTGAAGSGKSTAADYLVANHGYTRVRFAGPLKDMMRAVGLTEEEIEGQLKQQPCAKLQGRTPRHAMQTLGTEWGRDLIGNEFWVDLWFGRAAEVLERGGRVVVDDCRFPNEAAKARRLGGVVWRIEGRGGIDGGHASEGGCGAVDGAIRNTATVADLQRALDGALQQMVGGS